MLQKLVLPSGLVRERAGSPGSVLAAGQLYLALADARDELHIKLAPDSESAADDLISAIPQVHSLACSRLVACLHVLHLTLQAVQVHSAQAGAGLQSTSLACNLGALTRFL